MNKIFIGTPCFELKVNAHYANSLLDFYKNNIDFEPYFLHDSLITRARNELITQFYENQEKFTHLLWLDSDVSISSNGLQILLNKKVNVIAAPVPLKIFAEQPLQSVREPYEILDEYFYKVEAAATGCFLMSKKSVVDLVESCPHYFDKSNEKRKIYNVFESRIKDNELLSEDWDICYKLRHLGYEIYVDSSFPVSHFGFHNYSRGPSLNEKFLKDKIKYS